ncbi:MAG: hypothetical protein JST36_10135 [Bacteroidetes bacterium]|nr:hypothetical protein [Bacteroidota bacterium]
MQKSFIFSAILMLSFSLSACAQTKKGSSKSSYFSVKSATVRNTLMGRQESGTRTEYNFHITWKSVEKPEVFYWRPSKYDWADVRLAYPFRRPGLTPNDYMIVEKTKKYEDVKVGDELIVSPHSHSHDEEGMPAAVKNLPVSALYFKIKGQWKYQIIKPKKLPDIVMP